MKSGVGNQAGRVRGAAPRRSPAVVRVRTHRYGRLLLRVPGYGDLAALQVLLDAELPQERERMVSVLHRQLLRPTLSAEQVSAWPDRLLNRVGALWLCALVGGDLNSGMSPEVFTGALKDYCDERTRAVERLRGLGEELRRGIVDPQAHFRREMARVAEMRAVVYPALDVSRLAGMAAVSRPMFPQLVPTVPSWLEVIGKGPSWLEDFRLLFGCGPALPDWVVRPPAALVPADITRAFCAEANLSAIAESVGATGDVADRWRQLINPISSSSTSLAAALDVLGRGTGLAELARGRLGLGDLPPTAVLGRNLFGFVDEPRSPAAQRATALSSSGVHSSVLMRGLTATLFPLADLRHAFARHLGAVTRDLNTIAKSIQDSAKFWADFRQGAEALDASGFRFLSHILSPRFVVRVGRLDPRTRGALLTQHLHRASCRPEFGRHMERMFLGHPTLRRRWAAVARGLEAHRQGDFLASIPVLLPQIEGIFTDLMVERQEAAIYRGKPHAKKDGRLKRDRNGRFIRFAGLDGKIAHCAPEEDSVLQDVVERFLNGLLQERNPILHGNRPGYGTGRGGARLSTRIVWATYLLAHVLATALISATAAPTVFPDEDAGPTAGGNAANGPAWPGDLLVLDKW